MSHLSPAKTRRPPLHHDELSACFLPSYSTPKWIKYPPTNSRKTKPRKGWEQWQLTWKIPRHKHRCEDCALWGRESRDNKQHHSLQKGAGLTHGEHSASDAKQRYPSAILECPSVSRIHTCGCWTWHGTTQSPAFPEQWLEARQDCLGNLQWH